MIELRLKEQVSGIVDLYNKVAEQLGYDFNNCNYDCTKIEVSADLEDLIESKYEDKEEFAMSWLIFGPKRNDKLAENTVALDTGFLKVTQ